MSARVAPHAWHQSCCSFTCLEVSDQARLLLTHRSCLRAKSAQGQMRREKSLESRRMQCLCLWALPAMETNGVQADRGPRCRSGCEAEAQRAGNDLQQPPPGKPPGCAPPAPYHTAPLHAAMCAGGPGCLTAPTVARSAAGPAPYSSRRPLAASAARCSSASSGSTGVSRSSSSRSANAFLSRKNTLPRACSSPQRTR